MDDARILGEQLDLLRKENDAWRRKAWNRGIVEIFQGIAVLVIVLSALYVGGRWAFGSSSIGHCYLERGYDHRTELIGSISWGQDRVIGSYPSLQEAIDAARLIKCPMERLGAR